MYFKGVFFFGGCKVFTFVNFLILHFFCTQNFRKQAFNIKHLHAVLNVVQVVGSASMGGSSGKILLIFAFDPLVCFKSES